MKLISCPKCLRTYPYVSNQGASIGLTNQCIVCNYGNQDGVLWLNVVELDTRLNEDGIIAERIHREKQAGYQVKPCPYCDSGKYLKGWDPRACPSCNGVRHVKDQLHGDSGTKTSAHSKDE